MHQKISCRFCEVSFNRRSHAAGSSRKPFAIQGAVPHYAPDRPVQVQHIFLDVEVDPLQRRVFGTVSHRVKVVAPEIKILCLDQVALQISEVKINGESTKFSVSGNRLEIHFAQSPEPDSQLDLTISFSAEKPMRGMYFISPDSDHPQKHPQVWTQGQDEDNRYWFPSMDYPNQKATSEVRVKVPAGFMAISNGALLSKNETPEGSLFHYRLGTPHVTYLITLVVGKFSEWVDAGPRGVPIQYFVPHGREQEGRNAFGNTPKMIEVFEQKTGMPYPYEKYSQVAVQDFIFGGMENTSATTQTDLTLHDDRAHLDFTSDPLVAHELAHQWFGDLLTCRDWSHGWLNEGFATFMERVWIENDSGPFGGMEEAKYSSYQDWKEYLADDQARYRRPIVCNVYIEPINLFDTHLYQKGGLVLNLIRSVLGDALFWKSIQLYVSRHRGQNVETLDLIRAIEDASGRNLRRFFDEWVFNAGYPEFEISYQWHEDKKQAEWVIEQKQTGGAPSVTKDGATTGLFHLSVPLELTLEDGKKIVYSLEISEARERIFIPAPSKPVMVRFDRDGNIPKLIKFPRPKEMLLYQLIHDTDGLGRIEAAQELGKVADHEGIQGLAKAVASDSFWAVQAEVARVLAEIRTEPARDALLAALSTSHPKARRAIAKALGSFKDEKTAEALKKRAEKDPSYFVEADSTLAWTQARLKPTFEPQHLQLSEVEDLLYQQLKKESYRSVIQSAALYSFAELPGIGSGDRPHVLQTLIDWTRRGKDLDVRGTAVRALGKVLKTAKPHEKAKILDVFSFLSAEDNFRLRTQLVAAISDSEASEGIPVLSRMSKVELDGRVKRAIQEGIDQLGAGTSTPESVTHLKTQLEKMDEEFKKFRAWAEENKKTHPA